MKPILHIFSGLPGTGKTTIAAEIARRLKITFLRLDSIEHGLKEICFLNVQGEGYRLTYRIAADNLRMGNDVVIDCVNPWKMTRDEWEKVAIDNNSNFINIEIQCSNKLEHKNRIETRKADMEGFKLPTWEEVEQRDYQEWGKERIRIETSNRPVDECIEELLGKIEIEKMKFA